MPQPLHKTAQVFAAGNRRDRRPYVLRADYPTSFAVLVSPYPLPVPCIKKLALEGAVPASYLVAVSKGTATEDFQTSP